MTDFMTEFAAAAGQLYRSPKCVEWLARQDVPADVIYGPHACVIGVGRIETDGHTYYPDPSGQPAIIVPVSVSYETGELDPIDLVSWLPRDPSRWWLRKGVASVLGDDGILRAWLCRTPLVMHETPLHWLQAGSEGACVLDWCAYLPFHFHGLRQINCQSKPLALRLDRALRSDDRLKTDIRYRRTSHAAA